MRKNTRHDIFLFDHTRKKNKIQYTKVIIIIIRNKTNSIVLKIIHLMTLNSYFIRKEIELRF